MRRLNKAKEHEEIKIISTKKMTCACCDKDWGFCLLPLPMCFSVKNLRKSMNYRRMPRLEVFTASKSNIMHLEWEVMSDGLQN